ncbi:MAG TPA: hypothetical protein VLT16_18350 [Candidatus Limnocylindrales bacterium]|nr:hypothetical protein [Candidatus Limnocylindrales bacterium]
MTNTLFALWIGLSVALLLLFLYAAFATLRSRQTSHVGLDELIPDFLPVDVEAFAELVRREEDNLSSRLSRAEVLELRRVRIGLTIEFLERMTHNAALLQRLGYSQLQGGNPLISDLAQQMIDAGVHVRLYTFVGLIALRVCSTLRLPSTAIFPAKKIAELQEMMSGSLIPAYEQMKNKAGNLTCLKFSGLHEALFQNL